MRTAISTSEPSIIDQLEALSISSSVSSANAPVSTTKSARSSSIASSGEFIVVPRSGNSHESAFTSARSGSLGSSAVLVSAGGSRQPSVKVESVSSASGNASKRPKTPKIPSSSVNVPNKTVKQESHGPEWGEGQTKKARRRRRLREAASQSQAISRGVSSATTDSLPASSLVTKASNTTAQKKQRKQRRKAEKLERQRIGRDYANHTPVGFARAESDDGSTTSESTLSSADARSSVDAFLRGEAGFMSDKNNKLRLWQSLCIEFGLCEASDRQLPDLPYRRPASPSARSNSTDSSDESDTTVPSIRTARSVTPKARYPMPQSLSTAKKLLKAHAHVNLPDYLHARRDGLSDNDYSHLVHPTPQALRRYTLKKGKFCKLKAAKRDWLQPLLKDFGFQAKRM